MNNIELYTHYDEPDMVKVTKISKTEMAGTPL